MTLELVLIRHGVTAWNRRRVLQGHTDVPLSEEGLDQAERLVAGVKNLRPPTRIYASDLQRAYLTAQPLSRITGVPITRTPLLRERCFGGFEGCPWDELQQKLRDAAIVAGLDDHHFRPEGGESRADVEVRLRLFLAEVEATEPDAATEPVASVWVVTHGGVVRNLLRMLVPDGAAHLTTGFAIPNASISVLRRTQQEWQPVILVDTHHLADAIPPDGLDETAALERAAAAPVTPGQ